MIAMIAASAAVNFGDLDKVGWFCYAFVSSWGVVS